MPTQQLYALLSVHHNMYSPHLSPYNIIDMNPDEIYQFYTQLHSLL